MICHKSSITTRMMTRFGVLSSLMLNFDRDEYVLPTKEEVAEFLKMDKTNREHWTDSFRCGEFAKYVALSAAKKDWACAAMKIIHKENNPEKVAHYVVIFFTTDGYVVIEPQTDGLYPFKPSEYRCVRADFN